jgi:hypothetical protein
MTDEPTRNDTVVFISQALNARRFTAARRVEAYWHGLRGARALPSRSEVDPRGIEDALEYAFLIERIAPGHARLRVAGMHLSDLVGMDVRGMPLSTLIAAPARRAFADALERVFARPAIARLSLAAQGGFGRPALEGHMLLMPLRSDTGEVSRALGCLETQGRLGRAPRRFVLSETSVTPLDGQTEMPGQPARKSPTRNSDTQPGFAEPRPRFSGADNRNPPYLRLVKGDSEA